MREAAQAGGWASIPAAVRILILSVFAAFLWLFFGIAGSASADEAPAPDHSLLGQVVSTLDSVAGQATAGPTTAPQAPPAAAPSAPATPIIVSNLVTPVAQRLDSAVQALPVVKTIVSPVAVETVTAPVTAGVDAILDAIVPVTSLPVDVVEILPSIPVEAVATNSTLPITIDQRDAAFDTTATPDRTASLGVTTPDVSGSPSAPSPSAPTPSAPASPGALSSSTPSGSSGAPGGLVAITVAPSAADRALGRGSLPHNDSLPFSLSLAPGSSPD